MDGELVPQAVVTTEGVPEEGRPRNPGDYFLRDSRRKKITLESALLYPDLDESDVKSIGRSFGDPPDKIAFSEGGVYVDGVEVRKGVALIDGVTLTPQGAMIQGMPALTALEATDAQGNPVEGGRP